MTWMSLNGAILLLIKIQLCILPLSWSHILNMLFLISQRALAWCSPFFPSNNVQSPLNLEYFSRVNWQQIKVTTARKRWFLNDKRRSNWLFTDFLIHSSLLGPGSFTDTDSWQSLNCLSKPPNTAESTGALFLYSEARTHTHTRARARVCSCWHWSRFDSYRLVLLPTDRMQTIRHAWWDAAIGVEP